jgi:AmmeMemoRadiSam system protein B
LRRRTGRGGGNGDFFTYPVASPSAAAPQATASAGPRTRALIAPHIDFHRGGPTYAWAYREILERSDADLYVVLGTCHAGMPDPFAVTLKPYETPLGAVPVDREFYDALNRRAGQTCWPARRPTAWSTRSNSRR